MLSLMQIREHFQHRIAADNRLRILERLKTLIDDGLSVHEGLGVMLRDPELKSGNDAKFYTAIICRMHQGQSFGEALRGYVPDQERVFISLNEKVGALVKGLDQAIESLENGAKMKGIIRAALAKPFFIMLVLIGIVGFFSYSIFPDIAEIAPPAKWPDFAQNTYGATQTIRSNGLLFMTGITALVWSVVYTLPRWHGHTREKYFDPFAPFSFYRDYQSAMVVSVLSALVGAGMPMNSALVEIRRFANPREAHYITLILMRLKHGLTNGSALALGLFPAQTRSDLRIFADRSSFDEALARIGKRSMAEAIVRIESSAKTISTVMMAVGALIVLSLLLSVQGISGQGAEMFS